MTVNIYQTKPLIKGKGGGDNKNVFENVVGGANITHIGFSGNPSDVFVINGYEIKNCSSGQLEFYNEKYDVSISTVDVIVNGDKPVIVTYSMKMPTEGGE